MKILLANYRYFISGGPERYMFNISNALEAHGHEIIPFSINYSQNVATPYADYFVGPLGSKDAVYFDQHKFSTQSLINTISRLFYSPEVEKTVIRLITDHHPQVAYILHYLRKLSPSLLNGIKKKNLPIAVRLSDYAMLCPQAHCLRNDLPCDLCSTGNLLPSIKYKCIKGNLPATLLNALATWYHHKMKFFDLIDVFICTNRFMYKMMVQAGYPEEKLFCLPTFTDTNYFKPTQNFHKSNYIAYAGRIDYLKGIHVLIDAFALLKKKGVNDIFLKVAGTGNDNYTKQCLAQVKRLGLDTKIEFIGNINSSQLPIFLGEALFSVVPSLWYENLPNTILESYACGTPVLASDIGSLSDCVDNYQTGFLFTPGDPADLADKMAYSLKNSVLQKQMALNARQEAEVKYAPGIHVDALICIFDKLVQ